MVNIHKFKVGDLVTAHSPEAQRNRDDVKWGIVVERYKRLPLHRCSTGSVPKEAWIDLADVHWVHLNRTVPIRCEMLWKPGQV